MHTLITIVHVLVSVFMILVILLQAGKSGGLGLGGGGSATVFGGRGSQTFLGKLTAGCAAIFMITSLTLAFQSSRTDSVVQNRQKSLAAKQSAEEKKDGATTSPSPSPAAATPAPTGGEAPAPGAPADAPKANETK